ncbi:MAG: hypothetical protein FJY07_09970, partial [Bacteroidetes bacterium]|nr:hypothetical protein [Bacteroidota bacterium]
MQELFFSFVKSSGINSNISREYFLRLYAGQQLVDRHSDEFLCTIVSDNRSSVFNDLIRLNDHESVLVLGEPVHKGKTFKQIEVFTDLIGDDKQFFKRLDGEFVILVINPTHQEITIYTSKLGLIPVYIFLRNKGIIITTRLGIIYQMVEKIGQNQAVKMQQCIYNYCFSDQTIFQNVTLLPSASVIQISGSGKSVNKYWSVIDEMESHPLSRKDSIVCINRSLDGIINDFLSDQKEVAISLTGGWDGRLILAYALKHLSVDDILLYSFGTKDAPDVFLPERTSKKLGFKYLPVYLDDKDYQDKIVGWAKDTAYNSDGMRSIKRSHYLYAMNLP